ncbi:NUDIX hydrolase [Tuberibacillus sp. Marseille-P3662]|uniref:NUDIX hydrolase n=1 Tax=Tuberibacillus sp. Marseille-P3662 TaxID=1965358 RepID=UPI000A1CB1EF|nr:NUDIX domain-containing protein [Tuberibacillus sp. Marseille-P3662]
MTSTYVDWGGGKVKLTWHRDHQMPDHGLITSVHGFCFHNKKLLLVDLNHRGWDFPGGHIELNETPETCFKREAMEEGYVEGDCNLLGYIAVDHTENPKWSENSPYPKVGYQVFYRLDIKQIYPFEGKYESIQRIFINPNNVTNYYGDWHILYQEILDFALNSNE